MKDDLGNRMKQNYEVRTRTYLPRRTNTIIRIDGKAFHTFTKKYRKPFDDNLIQLMNETAKFLCENIQGSVIAYVQSDEISILLQDYDNLNTDAWFDGNVQKITSISASMATAIFNQLLMQDYFSNNGVSEHFINNINLENYQISISDIVNYFPLGNNNMAMFDSRVFTIPEINEVMNYFYWRQQDAVRNSISMVAQSLYSHKELNGKSTKEMQELILKKGQNWNDLNDGKKRGRMIIKESVKKYLTESVDKVLASKNGDRICLDKNDKFYINIPGWVIRDSIDFNKKNGLFRQYLELKNNINLF